MGINDNTHSKKSPQILPFQVKNHTPQLSINTDDKYKRLFDIKYYKLVKKCCLRVLHNEEDAKEMTQNVFENIHKSILGGTLNINTTDEAYLYGAARNMSFNEKKRAKRSYIKIRNYANIESLKWFKGYGEQKRDMWESGLLEEGYEHIEVKIIVDAFLAEQDELTKKIIWYRYYYDMTLKQIGKIIGGVEATVLNKLKKIEKQLKDYMEKGKE